jgi:squalene-hopene/tetraprenyl-beta-curcumene cyclase
VPRLPFELACLPQSWYRFAGLPVVSYALPALIAIGQCVHAHLGGFSPLRPFARRASLKVLRRIQPSSGGYLEATPLTAFVVMGLCGSGNQDHAVVAESVRFLRNSVRADGSWPIDTDLSLWLTTLTVNALSAAGDLDALDGKERLLQWLSDQQTQTRHPFTGAAPGAWGWSDQPGSVPDCDDTPGALLAVRALGDSHAAQEAGCRWVLDLQNRDGGWPTFCRGWGKLPFDRSGADLTAHALRALALVRADRFRGLRTFTEDHYYDAAKNGVEYLQKQQRPDGSWLPLWFGNQHAPDDENPVYGTARVLAAYRDIRWKSTPQCQRGVSYLLNVQNPDGGWGGAKDCPSSVEETAVAVEVLIDLSPGEAVQRGLRWLIEAVESGRFREPSPIGFYFAKLWYFEKLYPLIFTVGALGRAARGS